MKHLLLAAFAGAAALFGLGMVCATNAPLVPEFVQTPDAVYPRAEAEFRVATTVPGDRDVVYVLDWGDGAIDTTNGWLSGDTVALRHTWQMAGGFEVKALAFVQEEPDLASDWSEPLAVTVQVNGVPVAHSLEGPAVALYGTWAQFRARAADSDDDSVALQFDFNGTIGAWTAFGDTGAWFEDSFKFSTVETATVRVRARDAKGSVSGWSDSVLVPVDTVGLLLWYWQGWDYEAPLGQLLMVLDGADEVALFLATDGMYRSVDVGTGRVKGTLPPEPSGDALNGLPAYCAATGHIIVGSEFGALYALTTSLQVAWRWTGDDTMSFLNLSAPAIRGDSIYIYQEPNKLHCFRDLGDTVELVATRLVISLAYGCAPLVQSSGAVYYLDDWGQLGCWLPGLDSLAWLDTLRFGDDRWCIAAGENGAVYCGGQDEWVYAVNLDGEVAWSRRVDYDPYALVVGDATVFVATADYALVALDAATGATRWSHELASYAELCASPMLTANGLIYCQDNDDVLYCIDRSDGSLVWSCDCPSFAGVARGRGGLDTPIASPTMTSNGDIILVGRDALYCVKGYRNGPLDPQAVWPKWQHDAYNSGSVED